MNILTIVLDQVRSSDLGYTGGEICHTPNIDRLAAESVSFARTYTVCPVCSPARATFMTGMFPHSHRIFQNVEAILGTDTDMANDELSLGPVLKSAGYNLGFVGKYHIGEKLPHDYGFEGMNVPGHGSGGYASPDRKWRNCAEYNEYLAETGHKKGRLHNPAITGNTVVGGTIEGPEEATVPYFLAERANRLLTRFGRDYRENQKPFLISLNFWGPHPPAYIPEPYASMYLGTEMDPWPSFEDDLSDKPVIQRIVCEAPDQAWEYFRKPLAYYYGFLSFIDRQIGRVLDKLEAEGLADDTVVLFTADHGGFHGHHGGCLNKGFRMYDEITRIPLLARVPGVGGGREIAGFASAADLYPTILDFAGVGIRRGLHGQSLKPVIMDPRALVSGQESAVIEFHGLSGLLFVQRCICYEHHKYVYNATDIDELYDLEKDPYERHNLIESVDPGLLRRLKLRLLAWMHETGDRAVGNFVQLNGLHDAPPVKCYGFELETDRS